MVNFSARFHHQISFPNTIAHTPLLFHNTYMRAYSWLTNVAFTSYSPKMTFSFIQTIPNPSYYGPFMSSHFALLAHVRTRWLKRISFIC